MWLYLRLGHHWRWCHALRIVPTVLPKVSEAQHALHFVENTSLSGLMVSLPDTAPVVMLFRRGLSLGSPLIYLRVCSRVLKVVGATFPLCCGERCGRQCLRWLCTTFRKFNPGTELVLALDRTDVVPVAAKTTPARYESQRLLVAHVYLRLARGETIIVYGT